MSSILQSLDAEWQKLAVSPAARRALVCWGDRHPELAGHRDLHDVLATRHDPTEANGVQRSLIEVAATDDLAARVLLQMLLPGLGRIAGLLGRCDPDAADELVAFAWERIRTYPASRLGSVAANVVLDVRKQYVRLRQHEAEVLTALPQRTDVAPSPEDVVMGILLIEEIDRAREHGVVCDDEYDTIMRSRIGGESISQMASEKGLNAQQLWTRRWRAERRLSELPLAG